MIRRIVLAMFTLGLCLPCAQSARAETPEQTFDSLFGKQLREALDTPEKRDDAELARKFVISAAGLSADKPLQSLLLKKAYDISCTHPEGYAVAIDAMEALGESQPSQQDWADANIITILEKQADREATAAWFEKLLDAADAKIEDGKIEEALAIYQKKAMRVAGLLTQAHREEVELKVDQLATRNAVQQKVQKRIADLKSRSSSDPKAAAELAVALLVEMDDPKEAARAAELSSDSALKKITAIAAKEQRLLTEAEAIELGDWYRLQTRASDSGKAIILTRANACYERFLAAHTAEDAARLRARLVIKEIDDAIMASNPGRQRRRTVDLLAMINPAAQAVNGAWRKDKNTIIAEAGPFARLRIPYTPPAEYDLRVEFTRKAGNDAVAQILTHNGKSFAWIMGGDANKLGGFELIDQKGIAENATTIKGLALENGKKHQAVISIRKGSVSASLDGKNVSRYKTRFNELSSSENWSVGDNMLGLGANASNVIFHAVELVEITGEGKPAAGNNDNHGPGNEVPPNPPVQPQQFEQGLEMDRFNFRFFNR